MSRTQIMCTVGPTANTPEQIAELIKQGATTIRVNCSHGTPENHTAYIQAVRDGAVKAGKPVRLMCDIQGPKFRVGQIKSPCVMLEAGQEFILDSQDLIGDETRCYLPHPEFIAAAEVGQEVTINDGLIELIVTACHSDKIITKVVTGGQLSSRKGISMPNVIIKTIFPTEQDLVAIQTAIANKVDSMMLSFVQCREDVLAVKRIMGDNVHMMAKIETPAAVRNLKEIVEVADSVMVARGDLGVEARMHNVPEIQDEIIQFCNKENKECIVATQFLESLVNGCQPTRAEVNDIYTTVQAKASGILLTGETANGCDPANAIQWLRRVVEGAERDTQQ